MANIKDLIKTEFHQLEPIEILQQSPLALQGVSPQAETTLKKFEIVTIFDLACSQVFASAAALTRAGNQLVSAFARFGAVPRDLVIENLAGSKPIDELQFADVSILEKIGPALRSEVEKALNVATVRDLALYPPYLAAQSVFQSVFLPQDGPLFDPEAPADLIPKSGEYPTERVQYTTLVLDAIHDDRTGVDIKGPAFKPIDVALALKRDEGFQKVAEGALLTFSQSWFMQGLTLGQLLHSMALAPGESTRIAVIDWSRTDSGRQSESISEVEDLTNETAHNRSISEVTQAVATEAQQGFSQTNSFGSTSQSGGSTGIDLGFASFGGSSSGASNESEATSYSSSSGRREISASMSQQINDRTHQHAHAARSRRASVVREVAQSEHETISTRVITNYNHMHALTVQYFEVVQIYRVEVQLTDAQRVLFIPVELIEFRDPEVIERFQAALIRAALTREIRELLQDFDVVEVKPAANTKFVFRDLRGTGTMVSTNVRSAAAGADADASAAAAETGAAAGAVTYAQIRGIEPSKTELLRGLFWSSAQLSRLSHLLNRNIVRRRSASIFLPSDTQLADVHLSHDPQVALTLQFHTKEGKVLAALSRPILLTDLLSIRVSGSASDKDIQAGIVLTLVKNGILFPVEFPAITIPKGAPETLLVEFSNAGLNANLITHLRENKQHYSQAIFRSLSSTEIAAILAGFTTKIGGSDVPVVQVVDPKPVAYVGNFIAFRVATDNSPEGEDADWNAFKKNRGIVLGRIQADIVPLGSGGVFAEAVLGRFNCAEKLDITRFWNWQDSPIPIQPSEIAAIQAGSRAQNVDLTPGQLSSPVVNITNPTALPDPTGMSGVLAAIQNGNMFRDMSGLAQNIALAQAALQASAQSATSAGDLAVKAQTAHLQAQVEKMKIAADLAGKLLSGGATGLLGGSGAAGSSIGKNPTTDGSLINFFEKAGQSPAEASAGAAPGSSGPAATQGASATAPDAGGGPAAGTSGANNPAAKAAVFGPLGGPAAPIVGELVNNVSGTGRAPTTNTTELKIDFADNPQLHQKVVVKMIENTTTNVFSFLVTNDTFDFFELKMSLPGLTGFDVRPADALTKVFLAAPGAKDTPWFELHPKAGAATFGFNQTLLNAEIGDSAATHQNTHSYALPFSKGEKYKCLQTFSGAASHTDEVNKFAVDLELPNNTVICAARGGVVVEFDESRSNSPGPKPNFIRVLHDDRTYGSYLHLNQNGVDVTLGKRVAEGDVLGHSGNSGESSGPHLHFAVLKNDGSKLISTTWGFAVDGGTTPVLNKLYEHPQ